LADVTCALLVAQGFSPAIKLQFKVALAAEVNALLHPKPLLHNQTINKLYIGRNAAMYVAAVLIVAAFVALPYLVERAGLHADE